MTAGTSTGSILAAGLSCPAKADPTMPGYFADDLLNIYKTKKDEIFAKNGYSVGSRILISLFSTILIGGVGFFCAYLRYNQKKKLK